MVDFINTFIETTNPIYVKIIIVIFIFELILFINEFPNVRIYIQRIDIFGIIVFDKLRISTE